MATLVIADYVVIVVFLAISIGIGIYYSLSGDRQKSTQVREGPSFLSHVSLHFSPTIK